jgi:hypothetical protein
MTYYFKDQYFYLDFPARLCSKGEAKAFKDGFSIIFLGTKVAQLVGHSISRVWAHPDKGSK